MIFLDYSRFIEYKCPNLFLIDYQIQTTATINFGGVLCLRDSDSYWP